MCGRFTLKTPVADWLADLFPSWLQSANRDWERSVQEVTRARYNIAPTQQILVGLCDERSNSLLKGMRWGLLPSWADALSVGYNMINARSESLADKPSFRPSLVSKRCVVFADGYYEWKKISAKIKEPYWIHTAGEKVFAMAGLWAENRKIKLELSPDSPIQSATIITTSSNSDVSDVHDRMPVIFRNESQIAAWLDPALNHAENIDRLLEQLHPSSTEQLFMRRVSTLVNSPANESPELLAAKEL